MTTTWEEDPRSLNGVLEVGRDVACSKVKNIVNNGGGTMSGSKRTEISELLCEKDHGIAQHVSWAMAMKK
jgi:hypothetical protein